MYKKFGQFIDGKWLQSEKGELLLGTWQGIYLFEHRLNSQTRKIIHHFIGE